MPKRLTKEQMRKYQQDRRERLKDVKPVVKPSEIVNPNILGVKPLGLPLEHTSSTCNSFDTLPLDVQAEITSLTA